MKKRYWILGIGAAVTIIGGTDGPTSVFLAGKLKGGNDVAEWRMNLLRDISLEQ